MDRAPVMTRRLTWLFAVASGAAVGNLYWAQPLLDFIAQDLHASAGTAGWLVTATQVGYAAGILFIVPLGDVRNRRRLVPVMMLCAAVALTLCALAPSMGLLLLAITVLGITTVAGQLLAPAGRRPRRRRPTAAVWSESSCPGSSPASWCRGRSAALVADAAGWRTIFAAAAVADVLFAVLLYRAIPRSAPKTSMRLSDAHRLGRRRSSAGSGPCAGRWSSDRRASRVHACSGRR